MKEDLRSKESLITDVYAERLLSNGVQSIKVFYPFYGISIILAELFDNIWTHVGKLLLSNQNTFEDTFRITIQATHLFSTKLQHIADSTSKPKITETGDNLDCLRCFHRLFGRNADLAFPQQLLNEERDVTSGDWDVLNAAPDHITLSLWQQPK